MFSKCEACIQVGDAVVTGKGLLRILRFLGWVKGAGLRCFVTKWFHERGERSVTCDAELSYLMKEECVLQSKDYCV